MSLADIAPVFVSLGALAGALVLALFLWPRCEILHAHGAKASFNLNPGLHAATRGEPWRYKDVKNVRCLSLSELLAIYGWLHDCKPLAQPSLGEMIPIHEWKHEVEEGRRHPQ